MNERPKTIRASGSLRAASFWDEVESCIESADALDLYEFTTADRWPIDAAPGFEDGLAREMRALVRRRYAH